MTKADVIAQIAKETGLEKSAVTAVVESFMTTVKGSMTKGNNVYLRSFGTFAVTKRAEKKARNISKNTTVVIPEHFVPTFKPAKPFVEKVKTNVK